MPDLFNKGVVRTLRREANPHSDTAKPWSRTGARGFFLVSDRRAKQARFMIRGLRACGPAAGTRVRDASLH